MPGPSLDGTRVSVLVAAGSDAATAARAASGTESGFGLLPKTNFASSPVPVAPTVTIVPGRSSPNRIYSDSMSSISRWIVRRSGRAPSTGS